MTHPGREDPTGRVLLDWALMSKEPGQREDYGIVVSSTARLPATAMDTVIRHYSPGVPAAENGGQPDAPPWVTFISATRSGVCYVGVSIRDWPKDPATEVDADRRVIVSTRLFCLPEADFSRELGSHLALYEAVRDIDPRRLPADRLVALAVTRYDRRALVAAATARRDPWLAAAPVAAALLLDRAVTIVPAEARDLRARIIFLDLVQALLPAGSMAVMSSATWTDVRSAHQIRLCFSQKPDSGDATRLDPARPPALSALGRAAPVLGGRTAASTRYAAMLAQLLSLDEDSVPWAARLDALVGSLAADATPCTLDAVADRLAGVVARTITTAFRDGEAGPLRRYLGAVPAGADPDGLLLGLIATTRVEPGDALLLAAHWPVPGAPGAVQLAWELAAELARSGYPEAELAPLVGAPSRVTTAIVRALLEPSQRPPAVQADAEELALQLALRRRVNPRADAAWAPLLARLATNEPLVLRAVLGRMAEQTAPTTADLLRWFDPAASAPLLRPFHRLVAPTRQTVGDQDVEALARLGPGLGDESLRALLALAIRQDRVPDVLPALTAWLAAQVARAPLGTRRIADWRAVVERLPDERDGDRAKTLELIGAVPARRSGLSIPFRRDGADKARPGTLDVFWVPGQVDSPVARRVREVVEARLPALPRAPGDREFSFIGDGSGQVISVLMEPGRDGGIVWRGFYGDHGDFAGRGGQILGLWFAAAAARDKDQLPPVLPLRGDAVVDAVTDPAGLARVIDTFTFAAVADVAARLLDGPVAVIGSERNWPSPRHRMFFLAAVLALLPAGVSAALSVATLARESGPFRLAFTAEPPDDRYHVAFPKLTGSGDPMTGLASRYASRLRWALVAHGGTAELVAALATMTRPVDLDEVDGVLTVLGSAANPAFAWPAPGRSKDLAAARELRQAAFNGREFADEAVTQAIRALLADGTISDLESTDRLVSLLPEDRRVRVLTALVRDGIRDPARLARVRGGTVQLIITHTTNPPDTLRATLLANPAAVASLLVHGQALNQLRPWLGWLTHTGQVPDLAVFEDVARTGRPASMAQARQVHDRFGPAAAALLDLLAAPEDNSSPAAADRTARRLDGAAPS